MKEIAAACIGAAIIAGCGTGEPPLQAVPAPGTLQPIAPGSMEPTVDARCRRFEAAFDQLVACQRANGTLQTFKSPKITWRIRYFVRYWKMPCNEAPTEEEGYVFQMVTNDLYDDPDLNQAQRLQIRDALFDGAIRCE